MKSNQTRINEYVIELSAFLPEPIKFLVSSVRNKYIEIKKEKKI